MEKRKIVLALVLVLSIVVCFLPWLKMNAAVVGEEPIDRDIYGYDYIVPLGAPYTAPVAVLNVIGFALSVCSFMWTRRIRLLNVIAGLLILVGAIASFGYTSSVAFADVLDRGGSFSAWGDYGMGLEALFGFLMIIIGASARAWELMRTHAWELTLAVSSLAILIGIMQQSLLVFLIGIVLGGIGAIGFILHE